MKKNFFTIIFYLVYLSIDAQALKWVHQLQGIHGDELSCVDIKTDKEGNLYVLGIAKDTTNFNFTNQSLLTPIKSNSKNNLFVAKWDINKNLQWVHVVHTYTNIDYFDKVFFLSIPISFDINDSGLIFISAPLLPYSTFSSNNFDTLVSSGSIDFYNLILDKNNHKILFQTLKNTNKVTSFSTEHCNIIANNNHEFIISNHIIDTVITKGFKDDTLIPSNPNFISNTFIAKFDTNGNKIWHNLLSTNNYYELASHVEYDRDKKNILLTGIFQDSLFYNSKLIAESTNFNGNNNTSKFILKLTDDGTFVYVKVYNIDLEQNINEPKIALDSNNNIYTANYQQNPSNPNPSANPFKKLDLEISKYDSNGNIIFSRIATTIGLSQWYNAHLVVRDKIYFAGSFSDSIEFISATGNRKLYSYNDENNNDPTTSFLAIYSLDGNLLSVIKHRVLKGLSERSKIWVTPEKSIYWAGAFRGSIDFNPTHKDKLLTSNNRNGFVALYDSSILKYNQIDIGDSFLINPNPPNRIIDIDNNSCYSYPNPFENKITIEFKNLEKEVFVRIYNILGSIVYEKNFINHQSIQLNMENFSKGTYTIQILTENEFFNSKIIKQ